MSSGRAVLTAVLTAGLAGCPTEAAPPSPPTTPAAPTATTTTTTTPTTPTGAHAMADPRTPLPADALRPKDSDAFRLAASIVALGDGPWSPSALLGQPSDDRSPRPRPGAMAPAPTTSLAVPSSSTASLPRGFAGRGREVTMPLGDVALTFTMQDGSWEPSTGNSMPRMDEPVVVGITLTGPGAIASPLSADAVATEVMADDTGAATATTTALVQGRSLSFQQGTPERPFVLTRFVGRAPFQYSPAEHRALEDALIAITTALKEPIAVGEFLAARYADRKISGDGDRAVYDFGAGTLTVQEHGIGVQLIGPMRLPRLFAAHGIRTLKTSFAHNRGAMAETIHAAGFDLFPGRYTFAKDGRARSTEAEMGEAGLARFTSFAIGVKPRQIGEVDPAPPRGR
jgi:hypothetical protein